MKLWKRNAVVAAIVLFVCVAVYLNWSYSQDGAGETADTGKVLGEAALVGGKATDPLLKGENASSPAPSESPAAGEEGPVSYTHLDVYKRQLESSICEWQFKRRR